MGWISDLYETYENNISQVGKMVEKRNGKSYTLLPIGHTTQYAHIEVTVDHKGNLYSARIVDENDLSTVIPCTEDSSVKSGTKPPPHPLHDKLQYVAGDFEKFGGKLVKGYYPHDDYMTQLADWDGSPYGNDRIHAVFSYLKKGTLIEDLVQSNLMHLDHNGNIILKWTKEQTEQYGDKPDLFKVLNGTQDKAFVRFDTYTPGDVHTKVWRDQEMYQSFIDFYKEKLPKEDLCYITGKRKPKAQKHASGLRRAGDNAKLISANDTSGYTYRGRFKESDQVVSISYDATQKAHNALKWLIQKQGKTIDERVFLTWGVDKTDIPAPENDSLSLLGSLSNESQEETTSTHEYFAQEFRKAMAGYKHDTSYDSNAKINIMILDAATPGRLSVMYFRNLNKEDYLKRIERWHAGCYWRHAYRKNEAGQYQVFFGAPATLDIARSAYGASASDKLIKNTMERLLPCIVDGQSIPIDIVRSLYNRASNPVAMDKWEWEKTLGIACALINKYYEKEDFTVALDQENQNRDYLFGRLLAVADVLERRALSSDQKNRSTNALRYMNAFSMHPEKTWTIIQSNLQPYQAKLGGRSAYLNKLIDEIASQFHFEDFNNKPLSGKYLLGYYSQRHELNTWKDKDDTVTHNNK